MIKILGAHWRAHYVYNVGAINDSGINVKKCARRNGSSCGQVTSWGACVLNRAVQGRGWWLNQSHFRSMAEVSFLLLANSRKRASTSREKKFFTLFKFIYSYITKPTTLNGTNFARNELRNFPAKFGLKLTTSFRSSQFDWQLLGTFHL